MSQSRFSIVLVGVSALLRRPLVSRLRPAAFTARCSGGFCRSALPSVSEIAAGRVGLRAHGFRFSARTAFRHAPLRGCPRRVDLRAHGFRFSARTASGLPLGELALPLDELVLLPSVSEIAARWVGLRAHRFRFSACTASGLPSASWFFCLPFRRLPLGGLAFGLTASAFWHAPLRGCRSAGWFCRLPLRRLPLGELAFGLTASAFGMRRSAPPHRRREGRRSAPTRHLFHFKTLIPTC